MSNLRIAASSQPTHDTIKAPHTLSMASTHDANQPPKTLSLASSQATHKVPIPDTEAYIDKITSRQDDSPAASPLKCEDYLRDPPLQGRESGSILPSETAPVRSIFLPFEIVSEIFECLASEASSCYGFSRDRAARARQMQVQHTLAVVCRVSKNWYCVALPFLYRSPRICARNYLDFAAMLSAASLVDSSIKPAPIGSLIRRLDLSGLETEGRPSLNGYLVLRSRLGIEAFIAPQTSFGYDCLLPLSQSLNLRVLDLSVADRSVSLNCLLGHISHLSQLRIVNFPRSAVVDETRSLIDPELLMYPPIAGLAQAQPVQLTQSQHQSQASRNRRFAWPPNLEHFSLSGAVPATLIRESMLPSTLKSLHLSYCPFARPASIRDLISSLGTQLTTLSIGYPMLCLGTRSLDGVLSLCPVLVNLFVSAEYISGHFFREFRQASSPNGVSTGIPSGHPLARLELDLSNGSSTTQGRVTPENVLTAVSEGRLPQLRAVRISHHLGWTVGRSCRKARELAQVLRARAAGAGELDLSGVGIWVFDRADGNEGCGNRGLGGALDERPVGV